MSLAQLPALADGLGVASAHVARSEQLALVLPDGSQVPGRVVGVNTMVVGGLGVAVSVREVDALLANGPAARPGVRAA